MFQVTVACLLLAVLPSPAPAQRLLQPSYETAPAPRPLELSVESLDATPAASEHTKLKLKKASEDWELTGKRRRHQKQARVKAYSQPEQVHTKAYSQPEQASAESSPAYTKAYLKAYSKKSQPDQEYAPTDTHLEPVSAIILNIIET